MVALIKAYDEVRRPLNRWRSIPGVISATEGTNPNETIYNDPNGYLLPHNPKPNMPTLPRISLFIRTYRVLLS